MPPLNFDESHYQSKAAFAGLLSDLRAEYGHHASDPSPFHQNAEHSTGLLSEPLDGLFETILSQNCTMTATRRAMEALCAQYPNWQEAFNAGVCRIEDTLKNSGGNLTSLKARYVWSILNIIHSERGDFSLDFLRDLELNEARIYLESLPGVGAKTAACVLLFNLSHAVQPVDTHIKRVVRRLGITLSLDEKKIERILLALLPNNWEANFEFHLNCIAHGQKTCRAVKPRCNDCCLANNCPSSSKHAEGSFYFTPFALSPVDS